ncbi:MAG: hypothetical protein IPH57_09830 [Saprospiraceae bacterium]|nr:hypothetical protein [Saprospiraceae bacterium]
MKKIYLVFLLFAGLIYCSKEEDNPFLTCKGACNNFSYKIGNESGDFTANLNTEITYGEFGPYALVTTTGTLTYDNSGNTYQIKIVIDYKTCKYTVTVNNDFTCGN